MAEVPPEGSRELRTHSPNNSQCSSHTRRLPVGHLCECDWETGGLRHVDKLGGRKQRPRFASPKKSLSSIKTRNDTLRPSATPNAPNSQLSACEQGLCRRRRTHMTDHYDDLRRAHRRILTLRGSHSSPLTWAFVEVKGLEPSASTLRINNGHFRHLV